MVCMTRAVSKSEGSRRPQCPTAEGVFEDSHLIKQSTTTYTTFPATLLTHLYSYRPALELSRARRCRCR